MKNIKRYSIELNSDNLKQENDSLIQKNLKYLNPLNNPSFKDLQNDSATQRKPIKIIKLRNSDLKEKLKRISSIYYLKPKKRNNMKLSSVHTIRLTNNNTKDMINLDSNNNYDRNTRFSDKDSQMLNSISSILNSKNDNNLILPTGSKILLMKNEREIKLSKSNIINKIDNNKNDKGIDVKNNIKNPFNNIYDNTNINKFHEYDIKFHNSFFKNVNWNNNILKKMLQEKNMKINLDSINNNKYMKRNDTMDKVKEKKNQNVLKNINNNKNYINSYFNSDINKFYNNCKYKNNKLILSLLKNRKKNAGIKNYLSRFNDNNIYHNYCTCNIVNNEKPRNENKRNTISYEHEQNYSSGSSLKASSILCLKNI